MTDTNKPAWTPGPWKAVPTDPADGGEWYWIVGNRDGHNAEKELGAVRGPRSGTQAANAALIAAAPDLYGALVYFTHHYEDDPAAALVKAYDALAKAEGQP